MEFSRRKWGWYLTLWSAKSFKVKLLWFRKGAFCSKQKHFKRDEVWCFLFGKGLFYKLCPEGDSEHLEVQTGASCRVPVLHWHTYTAEKTTLVLEIQTGECREDDIERA